MVLSPLLSPGALGMEILHCKSGGMLQSGARSLEAPHSLPEDGSDDLDALRERARALCVSLLQHNSHLFGVRAEEQGSLKCFLPELIAFIGKCGLRACVMSSEGSAFLNRWSWNYKRC